LDFTLSLDEKLVKEIGKIAANRDTTLTELVREYLENLATESTSTDGKRRELEALERTFEEIHVQMGKKTWSRADLHE
jgi:metal-responsive CopG/Arc/MetJ family transcriptional regulator